jgi:hypothetical protein
MFASFASNRETLVRRRYITSATCLQFIRTMSLSLSVTFTFLALSQHPMKQTDLTVFTLRRVAIAHE